MDQMPRRSSKAVPAPKKRPGTSRDHDFATVARNVVEEAIGEKLTCEPIDKPGPSGRIRVARRAGGVKGAPVVRRSSLLSSVQK